MSKYRESLPQLGSKMFLTDGGIETTFVFLQGIELPYFAAFDLLRRSGGRETLKRYYESYIGIAREQGYGFVLESATWRASADWGAKLGYPAEDLATANRDAVGMLCDLRDAHETAAMPMVVSGCVGPRGDGYDPGRIMSEGDAQDYHAEQIAALADGGADMITAITMTNVPEAIGVARAASAVGLPVAISFTLETDGRLPTGDELGRAIRVVDDRTGDTPVYYMINCAHPTHFAEMLAGGDPWLKRLRGIRANASTRSHAELDAAPDLDDGNPAELGGQYAELIRQHGQITVLGGCCGTDHRHVGEIACACRHAA